MWRHRLGFMLHLSSCSLLAILGLPILHTQLKGFIVSFVMFSLSSRTYTRLAYSFLNPAKEHGLVAAYIAGIGAAGIIVFSIARLLCALRARIAPPRAVMPDGTSPIVERIKREGAGRWSWRRQDAGSYSAQELDEWEVIEREKPVTRGAHAA
jgi:hypothetical protein